jgi:hypothetical protein
LGSQKPVGISVSRLVAACPFVVDFRVARYPEGYGGRFSQAESGVTEQELQAGGLIRETHNKNDWQIKYGGVNHLGCRDSCAAYC